jgi:hypothetical protein
MLSSCSAAGALPACKLGAQPPSLLNEIKGFLASRMFVDQNRLNHGFAKEKL